MVTAQGCLENILTVQGEGGTLVVAPQGGTLHVTVDNPSDSGSTVTANQGAAGTAAWKVDGSGVTQPVSVSGTVPVSGTVAVTGAYQATQPVSIAATLPVSAATLPLPAGASTAALQGTGNASLATLAANSPALASGRVPTDGSGVTQPVSGTFWQATQPVSLAASVAVTGTFWQATQPVSGTVAVTGAYQATQPVSGTFWQATQPVSAASLPLPTGAATAARQPALGTAGSASADVLTVQGAASMTALKVDGSGVTQPVSGTVALSGTSAVSGTVTVNQGTAGAAAWKVDGSAVTQPVSVAGTVLVDASGHTVPVSLSALPALAAGSAKVGQVAIDQTTPGTSNLVQVSSVGGTVAVSAASLPLPSLAATSTIQATQQASLTSIDGKTPALSGGSVPVVLTAGVASVGTVGLNAGAASIGTVGLNAGSASIGTVGLNAGTASIGHVDGQGTAGTPAGGVVTVQGVAGGTAQPVSGTFWQATQPVSLASAPLPWGSSYKHLAAAGTTVVKTGSGVLRRVVVGGVGITSSVTLYDNTAGSGTVISAIASLLAGGHYEYNAAFATGLTVVVSAATPPDVTVIWD